MDRLHIRSSDGTRCCSATVFTSRRATHLTLSPPRSGNMFDSAPVAVGHRVVHGGPNLCTTPDHHATSSGSTALRNALCTVAHSAGLVADRFGAVDFSFGGAICLLRRRFSSDHAGSRIAFRRSRSAISTRAFAAMVFTVFLTNRSCITSAQGFPNEPSSRTWATDRVSVRFVTGYRSIPRWVSLPLAAFQWEPALATSTRASSSIFCGMRSSSADKLEDLLNHQSGLFALSSGESDVKTLEERARSGDHKGSSCARYLCRFSAKNNRRLHGSAGRSGPACFHRRHRRAQ